MQQMGLISVQYVCIEGEYIEEDYRKKTSIQG